MYTIYMYMYILYIHTKSCGTLATHFFWGEVGKEHIFFDLGRLDTWEPMRELWCFSLEKKNEKTVSRHFLLGWDFLILSNIQANLPWLVLLATLFPICSGVLSSKLRNIPHIWLHKILITERNRDHLNNVGFDQCHSDHPQVWCVQNWLYQARLSLGWCLLWSPVMVCWC